MVLSDRFDRVADAVAIARRSRAIAVQSIRAGTALSGVAMGFAAFAYLTPVAGALVQEAIDVATILNALRALRAPTARRRGGRLPSQAGDQAAEDRQQAGDHQAPEADVAGHRQHTEAGEQTDGPEDDDETSSLTYGIQMALAGQSLQVFDRATPGSTTLRTAAQWQEREIFLGNAAATSGAISLVIDDGFIDGAAAWSGVRLSLGGACTPPGAVTNPSPANTATGVTTMPTLSWSAASGAMSYRAYLGTSASSPSFLGSTTSTSISAGSLSTGTAYYWRIDSVNGCGTTNGSTWSFTTAAPSGPNLVEVSMTPSTGNFSTTTGGASTTWSPTGAVLVSSPNTDLKWWAQTDYKGVAGWNVFSAAGAENAPKLSITVSGLGSGRTYEVYGRYVSNAASSNFFGALMGLSSGSLTTYDNGTPSSQVLASSGNWRVREVLLGQAQAVGGSLVVYVDDNTMTGTAGWYGLRLVGQ